MRAQGERLLRAGIAWLGRNAPSLRDRLKYAYANYFAVPANTVLGIRIAEVAPDSSRVVVRLQDRRRNRNAAGTVHGAALFALAETVHGTAVMWQFSPMRHRMFTKTAKLDFLKPGRGELVVEYSLESATLLRLRHELAAQGRAELTAQSEVMDRSGETIATLGATYVVQHRIRRKSE